MCKRRQIIPEQALRVHDVTEMIPVRLLAVDIGKALDIAFQFNIYAYDAYFLECVRSLACPLIMLDRQMRQVAAKLDIERLE